MLYIYDCVCMCVDTYVIRNKGLFAKSSRGKFLKFYKYTIIYNSSYINTSFVIIRKK